ncbi:hypothetical protein CC117_26085 [Parafrankia colletiae]|uniref:Uncharacterized protein n=1 Tax=Parafrankia colletiae TaxID=573497 RepID=A0A1S1QEH2_9ACTN|nr:hypothetical protein CC117_26085 [Parafrankia colletiae]
MPAQRRQLGRVQAGRSEPAARPDLRVDGHRQAAHPTAAGEPGKAPGMVEVPVAENDTLDVAEVDTEPVGVAHHAVRRDAGVEQQRGDRVAAADADQRREPVLGPQPRRREPGLELRCLDQAHPTRRADHPFVAGQQPIVGVVHQRGDDDLVDRDQRDRVHGRAGGGPGPAGTGTSQVTGRIVVAHTRLLGLLDRGRAGLRHIRPDPC